MFNLKSFKKILLLTLFALALPSWATRRNVGPEETYTTINAAMDASQSGDTIWIIGPGPYDEDVPLNFWRGELTLMGAWNDPDSFPTIRLSGSNFDSWISNDTTHLYFRRLELNNMSFPGGSDGNLKKMVFEQCIVTGTTSSFINFPQNIPVDALQFKNTIFKNNPGTIFNRSGVNFNWPGPYGRIVNCVFYNNGTINSGEISEEYIAENKFYIIKNSIFKNNTTITNEVNLKQQWIHNIIPTSESLDDWGENSIRNDDPGFINSSPSLASHFDITKESVARDAGTTSNAPTIDIRGEQRIGTNDIGAYEFLAVPLVWDISTAPGIQPGDGTWGVDNFWTQENDDGTVLRPWPLEGDNAKFAGEDGGPYYISVDGEQNLFSLSFENSGYEISDGTLQFGDSTATIVVEDGKSATVASVVDGSQGLAKEGTGSLTITGDNTFSGTVTIEEGVLRSGTAQALGHSDNDVSVVTGGRLELSGSITIEDRTITILGDGGNFRGALQSQSGTNIWSGPVILGDNNARIGAQSGQTLLIDGPISDDGNSYNLVINSGGGVTILGGANTYGGMTRVYNGTLRISSDDRLPLQTELRLGVGASGDGTFDLNGYNQTVAGLSLHDPVNTQSTVTNNGAQQSVFTINNAGNFLFGGKIEDGNSSLQLIKNNSGTLTLTGNNTYSDGTVISDGTLQIGDNGTSGMIQGDITNNSSLIFSRFDDINFDGVISGNGEVTKSGDGTLTFTANHDYTGLTTITDGTLRLGDGGTSGGIAGDIVNDALLVFDRSSGLIYPGSISGTGDVTKQGNSVLVFTGENSYSGTTTVNEGTLEIGSGLTYGSLAGDLVNNAHVIFNRSNTLTYPGDISGTGNVSILGGGTLIYTGDANHTGITNVYDGTLQIGNGSSGSVSGNIENNETLIFHRTGSLSYNGVISGSGDLIKSNSGTLNISNTQIYEGTTTVNEGTLVVSGELANTAVITVNNSGTLAGTGIVNGPVIIENNAVLSPGDNGPGKLTTGTLTLNDQSILNFELGDNSDSVVVEGDLELNGIINIAELPGFGVGEYTIFTFSGDLINRELNSGSRPEGYSISIITENNEVKVVVEPEMSHYVWDVSDYPGFQANDGVWGTDNFWSRSDGDGTELVAWPGTGYTAVFAGDEDSGESGFSDNHSTNLDDWDQYGRDWELVDNYAQPVQSNDAGFLIHNYECANNGVYTATYTYTPESHYNMHNGGIVFRYTDPNNYYFVGIRIGWTDGASTDNQVRFFTNQLWVDDQGILIENNLNFGGITEFTLRVEMEDNTFDIYLNDDHIGQITDNQHPSGRVGYGHQSEWNPQARFVSSSWSDNSGHAPGPYSISVDGAQDVDELRFFRPGYTLSNGTINLTGTAPTIYTEYKAQIGSVISGSNGLIKSGTDTLVLTGENTYTGGTHLISGTLAPRTNTAIGSQSEVTTLAGGTLDIGLHNLRVQSQLNAAGTAQILSTTGNNFLDGAISGGGTLNITNTSGGIISFENSLSDFTGTINFHQGQIRLNGWDVAPSASSATINLSGTSTLFAHSINGPVNIGSLAGVSGTTVRTGNGNAIFRIGHLNTSTIFAGSITDNTSAGSFTTVEKVGTGTLTLSGANTYTGITTVSQGTLSVTGSTASGSDVTISTGATLTGDGNVAGTVTVDNNAVIAPGIGTGKLSTGSLYLSENSVLEFELGDESDTIAVTGDLTLDGLINITPSAGFGPGAYTILTYSGDLDNKDLRIGAAPTEYVYGVNTSETPGEIILEVLQAELLPVTVSTDAGDERCSVYTDNWTLIFDNNRGGGISVVTNSSHGNYTGSTGNQAAGDYGLYFIRIDDDRSCSNGSWSIIDSTRFFATIRQSGVISGVNYKIDYTIHGSGRIYIRTTFHNQTTSTITSNIYRHGISRSQAGNTVYFGGEDAWSCPYTLINPSQTEHFNILLVMKNMWNLLHFKSYATGLHHVEDTVAIFNRFMETNLGADQKQIWEFMLDITNTEWSDTTGVGKVVEEYRSPGSLSFTTGTLHMEKAWENHLSGHWTFEEGTGTTVYDNSGNTITGTVTGGTGSWVDGIRGKARQMDASQYIDFGNQASLAGTSGFTVMGWINPASDVSSSTEFFSKHNGTDGYKVSADAERYLAVTVNGTTVGATVGRIDTDTWNHVAASISDSTIKLYVDGKLKRIHTGSFNLTANSTSAQIGNGFNGIVDDFRFYNDIVSENTIKTIAQHGYSSSQGFYKVRADNNNTVHFSIDGSNELIRFPVFVIANYWADQLPAAGAVVLNGVPLTEGIDYFASIRHNNLYLGLNKYVSNSSRLFVNSESGKWAQAVNPTKKMNWGGDASQFYVKNFSGDSFGSHAYNQFYLQWKMDHTESGQGGEMFELKSSQTSGISTIVNAANRLPTDNSWTMGFFDIDVGAHRPRSNRDVQSTPTYTLLESSDVRVRFRVDTRTVESTSSYDITTIWTIYPTGQIFRYDTLSDFSHDINTILLRYAAQNRPGVTDYTSHARLRGGVFGTDLFQDFAVASLSTADQNGIMDLFVEVDHLEDSYSAIEFKNAAALSRLDGPFTFASYINIMNNNMSQAFIDSVANSVQNIGIGGASLYMMEEGGTLLDNTPGDRTGDGFNESEGAYVVSAMNNTVHFKLPAQGDTCRFYPAFRITDYYSSAKPQYIFLYTDTDTMALLEGYQYNIFHNKPNNELIFQLDTVLCNTTGIYISSDVTLAVTLSDFRALPGDGLDTLSWQTESEQDNLGFFVYRRISPEFLDSIHSIIDDTETETDTLTNNAAKLVNTSKICFNDTLWIKVNQRIIPGAESGVSYGLRDYKYIDRGLHNDVLYEYKLTAIDFSNVVDTIGYAEAIPRARIPLNFILKPNFPNPFRRTTTIRFELPVESYVSLEIFDLRGRLVKQLLRPDRLMAPNFHQVVWDGRNEAGQPVSAGQYLYRIRTDRFVKTRKMIKF
ncbi:autotransporter-associated beta strand repeat-containing protein [Chitinispirillales bacterium ANBcel5]|uniref:autotransporter-associated beta strand repeat-containing protein n=1 Tax=Cellulosispirillum alkaliphilum TaxID=3039283 RepID=UPI002A53F342|nr:autotransporter-associated beta strand repeat-containing protein [Chitinispirillales bacterium ANBcel5]